MASKKNTNSIHQRKAEKRARKVNRLAANGQKARAQKKELLSNSAAQILYRGEQEHDPETQQLFSVSIACGDELRTRICACYQSDTNERLTDIARGMVLTTPHDASTAIVLRFPPEWDTERVTREVTADATSMALFVELDKYPEYIMFGKGERFIDYVHGAVEHFTEWTADCGETPDENGVVEVDIDRSSAIRHVTYDAHTSTMRIEFQSGSRYEYSGVPRKRFTSLVSAPSVGHYFLDHIRDSYIYKRVA